MDVLFSIDDAGVYQKKDKAVIFNLDCRDILGKIGNESVDLFCSDIPYKIAHKGTNRKKERCKIYGAVCLTSSITVKKTLIILGMGKYLLIMILI